MTLIPAHAGVILEAAYRYGRPDAYPRARGGDPRLELMCQFFFFLSPRTRG